ncbi:Uncharacterised protein [Kingella potus]|uniref:Uncharacterized protein n=1 Tax=Kingella potus TaxID=265175 RepID=A0A377R4T9_9NEIS|nr:DUF4184 family protein [Kingella potus]UOO99972.1 DUF4184 family protein [Kingella potus]STR03254.1 Uncharacterised protein [Kingella potus]
MPFTLAHPFVVLPFYRCRFLHFPALVFGAMSPDFLYFLCGRPVAGGHDWAALWYLDVPLAALFYGVYRHTAAYALRLYLPACLNAAYPPPHRFARSWQNAAVFVLSAALGAATHILLDGFTHPQGWFVVRLDVLRMSVGMLPLFKWLQYGGGVFGLAAIAWFQMKMAQRCGRQNMASARQKRLFWTAAAAGVFLLLCVWQILLPVGRNAAAIWVIRLVDGFALVLLAAGCFCRIRIK